MTQIVVVDDDAMLRELIAELLQWESFEVLALHNGQALLDYIAEGNSVDIVILDVMMPVLNGWDTLKRLRVTHPQLPVLMLSAKGDSSDRVLGLELGADDYLAKPFDDRELVARIRTIVRRQSLTETPSSTVLSVDNLKIDLNQQQVFCEGEPIELTSTEFALLQYMVEHTSQLVTRQTISQKVLGKRYQVFDRAIDMHLSNLRKKLPLRKNGMPWIKTVHGRGYMLVAGG